MLRRKFKELYEKKLSSLPFVKSVEVKENKDVDVFLVIHLNTEINDKIGVELADKIVEVNREIFSKVGEYPSVDWNYTFEKSAPKPAFNVSIHS